jgi:hypothetical protein
MTPLGSRNIEDGAGWSDTGDQSDTLTLRWTARTRVSRVDGWIRPRAPLRSILVGLVRLLASLIVSPGGPGLGSSKPPEVVADPS